MSLNERVIQLRNDLNALAEPSHKEEKTSAYLADCLSKAGYEVKTNIAGYGITGELKGSEDGPVLALVADTDALIHIVDGKEQAMHTCGHDANCAMVMAAAEVAAAQGIKKGKLKIIFQPAEETLTGALAMSKEGAIDDVDIIVGAHLRPIQEAKLGQATPALWHGAATFMNIEVKGATAHGARPHLGVNPIDAAVMIVNGINSIHVDPGEAWSIKTTKFNSNGKVTNSVPDKVEMSIDMRAQKNSIINQIIDKAKTAIEHGAKVNGANAEILYIGNVPAAEYDQELTDIIADSIVETMGKEALMPPITTIGGDDFHFYKQYKPSVKAGFFGLGADLTPGLHNPEMCFNESALQDGVKIFVNIINKIL